MHIYPWQIELHPLLQLNIDALENHYTKLGRSHGRYTGRCNPIQLSIDAWNTATPNLADLTGRCTNPSSN